jgi:hypothetical protein
VKKLVSVGADDEFVKTRAGRVENFEIGEKERLIGCQLDHCKNNYLSGVTWLKMKYIK